MLVAVLGGLIAIGGFPSAAAASSMSFLDIGHVSDVAFDPTGERAYAGVAGGLGILDVASRTIDATVVVPLSGRSQSIAIDPVSGRVLIATGTADLAIVDPDTASVAGAIHLNLPPGFGPTFVLRALKVATSAALSRAFVLIQVGRPPGPGAPPPGWHLVSVDLTGGPTNQITTLGLGSFGNSPPTGIVVDDTSGHVYVGKSGTGVLTFDAATLTDLGTISQTTNLTFDSALAIDSENHRLYAGLQTRPRAMHG
jgi:DNA-binding beta-propeller fold protein YncE